MKCWNILMPRMRGEVENKVLVCKLGFRVFFSVCPQLCTSQSELVPGRGWQAVGFLSNQSSYQFEQNYSAAGNTAYVFFLVIPFWVNLTYLWLSAGCFNSQLEARVFRKMRVALCKQVFVCSKIWPIFAPWWLSWLGLYFYFLFQFFYNCW